MECRFFITLLFFPFLLSVHEHFPSLPIQLSFLQLSLFLFFSLSLSLFLCPFSYFESTLSPTCPPPFPLLHHKSLFQTENFLWWCDNEVDKTGGEKEGKEREGEEMFEHRKGEEENRGRCKKLFKEFLICFYFFRCLCCR